MLGFVPKYVRLRCASLQAEERMSPSQLVLSICSWHGRASGAAKFGEDILVSSFSERALSCTGGTVSVCARPQGTSENFCFRGPAEEEDEGTRAARDHRGYHPDLVLRGLEQLLSQGEHGQQHEVRTLVAAVHCCKRSWWRLEGP